MAKEQQMIDEFGDDTSATGAPPDSSGDGVVKGFQAFADEIIHLPIAEALQRFRLRSQLTYWRR